MNADRKNSVDCAHFIPPQQEDAGACGLVQILTQSELERCAVSRSLCEACTRFGTPSADALNPMVASLLTSVTTDLLAHAEGADAKRLDELRSRAIRYIRTFAPDDPLAAAEAREATACFYRGQMHRSEAAGDYECDHPLHDKATIEICRRCRDWSSDGLEARKDVRSVLSTPPRFKSHAVESWAVGVTTSSREQMTLQYTVDSLIRAGWDAPCLMADGPTTIPQRLERFDISRWPFKLGAWPNFYLTLSQLFMRHPHAEAFLVAQDDAYFYDREDIRAYLEGSVLWPSGGNCIVSLYCPSAYARPKDGWHQLDERWVWGALAFIFPNDIVRKFLSDQWVIEHQIRNPEGGHALVDVVVGEWASRNGVEIWYPVPSLVQHIGHMSTIWDNGRVVGDRRASRFFGDRNVDGNHTSDGHG